MQDASQRTKSGFLELVRLGVCRPKQAERMDLLLLLASYIAVTRSVFPLHTLPVIHLCAGSILYKTGFEYQRRVDGYVKGWK